MKPLVTLTASALATLGLAAPAHAIDRAHTAYLLGDSYAVKAIPYGLGTSIGAGWKFTVSGRGGRGIGGNITPTGLQQAVHDRAVIAAAGTVVVELGTNTAPDGSYFPSRAQTLLKTIRSYSPGVRILWVTPANYVVSWSYQAALARNRQTIVGLAAQGVTPIRWDLRVDGDVATSRGWFHREDGYKHPDADGLRVLVGMIDAAIAG